MLVAVRAIPTMDVFAGAIVSGLPIIELGGVMVIAQSVTLLVTNCLSVPSVVIEPIAVPKPTVRSTHRSRHWQYWWIQAGRFHLNRPPNDDRVRGVVKLRVSKAKVVRPEEVDQRQNAIHAVRSPIFLNKKMCRSQPKYSRSAATVPRIIRPMIIASWFVMRLSLGRGPTD